MKVQHKTRIRLDLRELTESKRPPSVPNTAGTSFLLSENWKTLTVIYEWETEEAS